MNNQEKCIRIAYLTFRDAQDRRTWSGTYYYMAQALQKNCGEVTYIGPLDASTEKLVGRIVNRGSKILLKKGGSSKSLSKVPFLAFANEG